MDGTYFPASNIEDLSRESCVQIGPRVHKVRYNNNWSFCCPKFHPNCWRLCRHVG